jgi:uncharacterized LabA/DUF88 family protein
MLLEAALEKNGRKPRIAVFVDGSNLFYLQRDKINNRIDLGKLLAYISGHGEIVDAYYYTGQDMQNEENKQQGFIDKLPHLGYSVVTKPVKSIYDPTTGNTHKKANLDVEIVLDMFNTIDNYDMAVLISGDGDFVRPLELLKAKGKTFKVFAIRETIAQDLLKLVGMHYVDFKDIIEQIKRD